LLVVRSNLHRSLPPFTARRVRGRRRRTYPFAGAPVTARSTRPPRRSVLEAPADTLLA
jgi:hypothetical protein